MFCCLMNRQCFVFLCMIDIYQRYSLIWHLFWMRFCQMRFFIYFQNLCQMLLLIVANHNIDCFICFQFFARGLHIASSGHYDCLWVHFFRFVKHLSGLAVCNIGYRTGIDDINICSRCKWYNLIPFFFQDLLHRLCLICVYFTSKIMERYFFVFHLDFFLSER